MKLVKLFMSRKKIENIEKQAKIRIKENVNDTSVLTK